MVGDIVALCEFILNRRNNKQEATKNLIEDFVDPVFSLFKVVHNDYLQTFRKYHDQIESNNPLDLNLIINEIEQDSLFSQNLIDELSASLSLENELSRELLEEIDNYLKSPKILFYSTIQPWSNVRRSSLLALLYWIDKATPEIIISTGLFDDVQNTGLTLRGFVSSIEGAIRFSESQNFQINCNQYDLNQSENTINEIKRFLALQCINFIVKETQENNTQVVNKYWQLKIKIIRLTSN